jgi:hypothetical protein
MKLGLLRHSTAPALAWALALALAACTGALGDGPARPPGPDGGRRDAGVIPCGTVGRVLLHLEERCGSSSCHGEGGRFPRLTRDGIAALSSLESRARPGERLVVPGRPEESWLYRKMAGLQGPGGGALMPLGVGMPSEEAELVAGWIRDGAETACDDLPPTRLPYDPNSLDPDALFACADAAAPRSSPARLRRVERREFTHAAMRSLGGTWWGSTTRDNPLDAPTRVPYSSYTDGVSIDEATLDLLMLSLDEVAATWTARDPATPDPASVYPRGERVQGLYDNREFHCIFSTTVMPDDACRGAYVELLLRRGTLFRAPSDGERGRLRALLDAQLDAEVDPTDRRRALSVVVRAALLMPGTLFRPELGEPETASEDGRRRLSADELALALGHVLSTHPVGVPLPIGLRDTHPDADAASLGHLSAIRTAADDGTIFDPAVRRALLRRYGGGRAARVADDTYLEGRRPDRHDLDGEAGMARGEYWLAPMLRLFFEEWLDYGTANTAFKDTPEATSAWSRSGFSNLQSTYYGDESSLLAQMDDTVARAVIESDEAGLDVFQHLLTTRMWRLPSNTATTSDVACVDDADCAVPETRFSYCERAPDGTTTCPIPCAPDPADPDAAGFCVNALGERPAGSPRCYRRLEPRCSNYNVCSALGRCANSISRGPTEATRVYGIDEPIEAFPDERWVTMHDARLGVLTHPAWLASHGGAFEDDASLVLRGKWIRERLFCETVPPLELVMVQAQLVPSSEELSARERVRESTEVGPDAATCLGCHRLMNPLGLPFEVFNHAGFERVEDHGGPVDGSTVIEDLPDPALNRSYATHTEFITALSESRYARRGFIRHAFRFFMGRDEVLSDGCTLAEMEAALDETGSFFAMLEALVSSETFTHRHLAAEAP